MEINKELLILSLIFFYNIVGLRGDYSSYFFFLSSICILFCHLSFPVN